MLKSPSIRAVVLSCVIATTCPSLPLIAEGTFTWSETTELSDPIGFAGPYVGVVGKSLVVAGGANFPGGRPWDDHPKIWHNRIFVLARPKGSWVELKITLPAPLAYGVSVTWKPEGGQPQLICVGGGDSASHSTAAFAILRQGETWVVRNLPSLPRPAAFLSGALIGDTVYVAGGIETPQATTALKQFLSLDLSKPEAERHWVELKPWDGPARMLPVAASQSDAFFLFSGAELSPGPDGKAKRRFLKDAHRYDPGKGWRKIPDVPRPIVAAPSPAPAVGESQILVLPGDDGEFFGQDLKDAHQGFPSNIQAYDTVTERWFDAGEFPKDLGPDPANDPHAGKWPVVTTGTTTWNDQIVVASGEARPGVRSRRVWLGASPEVVGTLSTLDYVCLASYFIVLIAMGIYFSRREKSTEDFFLGGRRIPWWAAALSIFGTQLSAITFMAIPAKAYRTDWIFIVHNMMIVISAPIVAYVYLPFFRRLNLTTAYEYLERRFDYRVRCLGSLSFCLFQLGRMGIVLYLPSLALATVTGIDVYVC
ncbi:MAG: hypothetical protein AAF517_12315, partial [Planctomycetota bacterium]